MAEEQKPFDPSMFETYEELLKNAPDEAENFKPLGSGGFVKKTALGSEDAQNEASRVNDLVGGIGSREDYQTAEELLDAEKIAKERLLKNFASPLFNQYENLNLSEEIIQSPEVQEAAKSKLIDYVKDGDPDLALSVYIKFNLPEDVFQSPAAQQAFVTGIFQDLFYNDSSPFPESDFSDIINLANLPAQFTADIDQENDLKIENVNLIHVIPFLGSELINRFFPITMQKIIERLSVELLDLDTADYFVENLDKYYQKPWVIEIVLRSMEHYAVAQKFIYFVEEVIPGKEKWQKEPWVADVFAKAKNKVEAHKSQSDEGQEGYGNSDESFRESDPYEGHEWRFSEEQARTALLLSRAIDGNTVAIKELDEILQKAGIDFEKVNLSLSEVYDKLNTSYQNFLSEIRSNPNINSEDKQTLLDPGLTSVRMTPLIDNVRSFVARYLIQKGDGDISRLSEIGHWSNDLDGVLAKGFQKFIKIHEVDVPLYDKLYEEFDNLRETGRYPLEVYLGRDGIYAWIGRRAQDVARSRKIGLEGRKKLKEMGEVLEINPQYTVYPRYFRDNLNYETKREFLEQERISPDTDPLFYDTGYTGTIPEQIMRVMGFSSEDIEQRIRLLSAPSVHRRVKGISENARSEIIEYIEHNSKTEEVAEGLIIDEKTGKIRHIAEPTIPEEQFYFMMIKQAITRHYWLQEQLHYEPSGNVNLDSEHFSIRIRQEYAKLLPEEFMHDPKAFLAEHGELTKGSKGEGDYPDEEIVLFKLTDGTEIVAKRIELRKAKEARKEFTILIAAKKAGLPTAEPVGFLSGKEDDDGSYLLMKKVEGRSGRHFEKELRESGKYSDEQIDSIMQTVAEKNNEMVKLFRTTLQIDKRWRIKDTIIEFNEETGAVERVIPIDWERAQNYDPENPKEIDEIT